MKKLLIFMLVFGMCSVANAAFTWRIEKPAGTIVTDVEWSWTVDLIMGSDNASAGGTTDWVINVDQAVSNVSAATRGAWGLPPNPVLKSATSDGSGGVNIAINNGFAGLPTAAGDFLEVTFDMPAGSGLDTMVVTFSGAFLAYTSPTGGNVPIIPEPMTIALLGLGGLFLVRRRT